MIDVRELRINNLVQIVNHTECGTIVELRANAARVEYIRPDNGQSHISHIEYRDLQPIPLTEEWLVNFGFEKIGEDKNENPIYTNGELMKFDLVKIRTFFFMHISVELIYVHQLQNLYFALTGEELKLK